jgi:hypothetical protein
MFKTGDLVTCIHPNEFVITDVGVVCRVVNTSRGSANNLELQAVKITKNYTGPRRSNIEIAIAEQAMYVESARHFKRYIPKLYTSRRKYSK